MPSPLTSPASGMSPGTPPKPNVIATAVCCEVLTYQMPPR